VPHPALPANCSHDGQGAGCCARAPGRGDPWGCARGAHCVPCRDSPATTGRPTRDRSSSASPLRTPALGCAATVYHAGRGAWGSSHPAPSQAIRCTITMFTLRASTITAIGRMAHRMAGNGITVSHMKQSSSVHRCLSSRADEQNGQRGRGHGQSRPTIHLRGPAKVDTSTISSSSPHRSHFMPPSSLCPCRPSAATATSRSPSW
jgi:hypothetical protein